jgi:hypothetical protein
MTVEQFLRWRHLAPSQRFAVHHQAALLHLRTELNERQMKKERASMMGGAEGAEDGEEEEEEEDVQAGGLKGLLAFDVIHSDDLCRHILEFL